MPFDPLLAAPSVESWHLPQASSAALSRPCAAESARSQISLLAVRPSNRTSSPRTTNINRAGPLLPAARWGSVAHCSRRQAIADQSRDPFAFEIRARAHCSRSELALTVDYAARLEI